MSNSFANLSQEDIRRNQEFLRVCVDMAHLCVDPLLMCWVGHMMKPVLMLMLGSGESYGSPAAEPVSTYTDVSQVSLDF